MEEQRKYIRFDSNALVKFQIKESRPDKGPDSNILDIVKNLSVHGVCVILDQNLKPNTVVVLEIYLPSTTDSIRMEGEVRWSQPFMNQAINNMFETGVKILVINKKDESLFIKYIKSKSE